MTWIRDPRPGLSWRAKRLRTKIRTSTKPLRARLPEGLGGRRDLSKRNRFRVAWGGHWYDKPVDNHVVVYESFAGNGALCNPRAIFDALLDMSDMRQMHHVWCFANLTVKREFDARFATHPRVRSVLIGSAEYYKLLSTAKYLVNNQTFPADFTKRPDQVYLNTWHGAPLKTMGYDSPEAPFGIRNTVRNFLCADYLLAPSEYTTRTLYEQGYRLRGIYRGTIIEEGYPRIDAQFQSEETQRAVRDELRAAGVEVPDGKIVLFAPTWRGTSFFNPVYDADALRADVAALAEHLGDGYTVLLKVHQQIFRAVSEHGSLRGRLVPNSMPTNRLLGAVDVLVTDYSSIFFDFLATGRPVLFYVPDAHSYERDRGVLIEPGKLPGPTYARLDELAAGIEAIATGTDQDPVATHGDRYREAAASYCPHDDGDATARVIDIVFRSREEGHRLVHGLPDDRTSILVSAGRARTSGVNTSLLSLLHNLDPARYDVTLFVQPPRDDGERRLLELIPGSVRQVVRTGTFPVTAGRLSTHDRFLATGLHSDGSYPGDEQRVLAAEWRHSFGTSRFDHAIDFSGYTPIWPAVLLQGDVGSRSIWLHNDMVADSERQSYGERFLHPGLPAVFTLYQHFDHLVSVSPALGKVNAKSLGHLAAPEKFTSASNTIDAARIRSLASGPNTRAPARTPDIRMADAPLPQAAAEFVRAYPHEEVVAEIARQANLADLLPPTDTDVTFVTVGRLAPEKNHARMIRAFASVHAERPDTRLLILGDGPLRDELEALTDRLELGGAVRLGGYQSNPYPLLAASDCFLLSSEYEGQPMVILEALTLGVPVVTVEFGSAGSALPSDGGIVVPQSDEGLADGMRRYLDGKVTARTFDSAAYNHAAMDEFRAAIGESEKENAS